MPEKKVHDKRSLLCLQSKKRAREEEDKKNLKRTRKRKILNNETREQKERYTRYVKKLVRINMKSSFRMLSML